MKERLVKSKKIYCGKAVGFSADTVRLANGRLAVREYLNHPGAVAVVALSALRPPRVVLVRQYRHPVRGFTWEIPAGKLARGEAPASCVRRELEEETGFQARRIRKWVRYWPTPAFSDEVIHIYAAWGLKPGPPRPDEDEFIQTRTVALRTALRWIKSGRIGDSKTVIGLLCAASRLRADSSREALRPSAGPRP